jgi:KipI family sensor histidine kinase inhibitor
MNELPEGFPRYSPVGDSALLLEFGERVSPALNARVHALDRWLKADLFPGITACVPGYASLLVLYDLLKVNGGQVRTWLEERWRSCPFEDSQQSGKIVIPVRYGGEDGPDLDFVARYHDISPEEVVRRHTTPTYVVAMMGFTPGFPYLLGLDPALATPRLDDPRTLVPAGSVGIAGEQTGIYPLDSPGGWQLIGRISEKIFDLERDPPFLLSPGDEVMFVAAEGSTVQ